MPFLGSWPSWLMWWRTRNSSIAGAMQAKVQTWRRTPYAFATAKGNHEIRRMSSAGSRGGRPGDLEFALAFPCMRDPARDELLAHDKRLGDVTPMRASLHQLQRPQPPPPHPSPVVLLQPFRPPIPLTDT